MSGVARPFPWAKFLGVVKQSLSAIPIIGGLGYFGWQLDRNFDHKYSVYKCKSKMFGPWSDPNNPPY